MKTYTYTLPKDNNSANTFKNKLMERMITAYPWLTIDSKFDFPKSDCGVEYASGDDMITLGLSNTHNVSWLPKKCINCPFSCCNGATNFNLEKEFPLAMAALHKFAIEHIPAHKDYDFETEFGVPVKFFGNFVQIGYNIIPFELGSLKYIKPEVKKIIIDITITIKNSGLY